MPQTAVVIGGTSDIEPVTCCGPWWPVDCGRVVLAGRDEIRSCPPGGRRTSRGIGATSVETESSQRRHRCRLRTGRSGRDTAARLRQIDLGLVTRPPWATSHRRDRSLSGRRVLDHRMQPGRGHYRLRLGPAGPGPWPDRGRLSSVAGVRVRGAISSTAPPRRSRRLRHRPGRRRGGAAPGHDRVAGLGATRMTAGMPRPLPHHGRRRGRRRGHGRAKQGRRLVARRTKWVFASCACCPAPCGGAMPGRPARRQRRRASMSSRRSR